MSKFDFSNFYGDCVDFFAASTERYTKEEATRVFAREMMLDAGTKVAVGKAWVRYRIGYQDGEKINGWWLEYEQHQRSCPVWCFHTHRGENDIWEEDYELYILTEDDIYEFE